MMMLVAQDFSWFSNPFENAQGSGSLQISCLADHPWGSGQQASTEVPFLRGKNGGAWEFYLEASSIIPTAYD